GLGAAEARAGEPAYAGPEQQAPQIANGEPVGPCAWPTAVAVLGSPGLCTGTLIHPELVVFAAHCGDENKVIHFGESAFGGGRSVAVDFCLKNPQYGGVEDQGHDWAFCKLAEPVTDLPITPPVQGCEIGVLQTGTEVAVVGFGDTLEDPGGTKHWGLTELLFVNRDKNITALGAKGTASICPGDSGGPAFVRYPEGGWRALGIASTVTNACGGTGTHSLLDGAIPWLEEASGLDLTPCGTQDGQWAPTPDCNGFFSGEANVGSGDWDSWCAGTPAIGEAATCGPGFSDVDPDLRPILSFAVPSDGQSLPAGTVLDVAVDVQLQNGGPAVHTVRLRLDGVEVGSDSFDPWVFADVGLGEIGTHELVAIAEDWSGGVTESAPITVGVGVSVPG
ncbi:MAG: trypsin-like serine protease, partial [Myxococcales bacterium]|nr:trypsin-like serine protease [Myxococcales bacterium]